MANSDREVLVVGAGAVGLFCAYFLRLRGLGVTVVDAGPVGGPQSCSSRNTGFVGTQGATPLAEPGVLSQGFRWLASSRSPFSITPRPSPALISWLWRFRGLCNEADARTCFAVLVDLKRRSLRILRDVCETGELAACLIEPGMIVAYKTKFSFDKANAGLAQAVERGVPLRVLDAAELKALAPEVTFDIYGALFNAEGAALAVPDFVTAFSRRLAAMGVRFAEDARVTGFGVTSSGQARGKKVSAVRTTQGDFSPSEVVIAAGAWSARCARMLGLRLALQPAKGYTVTVPGSGAAPRLPVLLSEGKVALMPLGDRLRFGGTLQLSGLSTRQSGRRVEGIVSTVRSYLPELPVGADREVWTGLRPCTPDSIPLIGLVAPYRNVSVAAGHGYIGMGLAPAGGKLLAQLIAGEVPEVDPLPFLPGRFGG
jgi:D-amino-acid dehydrogenase